MKTTSTLFSMLLLAATLTAQNTFELVKDISPSGNANPKNATTYNGKLYFYANDGVNGDELWATDGTATGTVLVKDINPTGSSTPFGSNLPDFTELNGKLYFSANGGTGDELWVTDGTEAGTTMLKDINPSGYSYPEGFTVYNGKLYFKADDGVHDGELWVTDGTTAGTVMVKDIDPAGYGSPRDFIVYNGKLYFVAYEDIHGGELWVTDGTTAGTVMVKDINPGEDSGLTSDFVYFTINNNKLYFAARDNSNGKELWVTDGTAAGTVMVKDIRPDGSSDPRNLATYNGKIYFNAYNGIGDLELWISDGTTAGTIMLKDINPTGNSVPQSFTEYNGKLYFTALDDINGREFWVTDGTTAGTVLVKDINPGIGNGFPYYFAEYNDKLYFTAEEETDNKQLWVTDGTTAGTEFIQPPIAPNANPLDDTYEFVEYDGSLYFSANYDNNGNELWKLTTPSLSVEDFTTNSFILYPNPVKDVLNINATQPTTLQLYSIQGQLLQEIDAGENTQIDISGLASGIYIVEDINTGNSRKLIKE